MEPILLPGKILSHEDVEKARRWPFTRFFPYNIPIAPDLAGKIEKFAITYDHKFNEVCRLYYSREITLDQFCDRMRGEIEPLR